MSIKKRTDGKWAVNIAPGGRVGPQFKRVFATQAEAKQFVIWAQSQHAANPEWKPEPRDKRRLSELVALWFAHHGASLAAGKDTHARLKAMCVSLGDPLAANFTAQEFADYRTNRLDEGVSANTLNREHAYLRSVFNELIRLGLWSKPNPLKHVRQFRIQERELTYLTHEQIDMLMASLDESKNPHVKLIATICLATGARWGEVESLRITQVRNGIIQYANATKSKKARAVPISSKLEKAINAHHKEHGDGHRIFGPAHSALQSALVRAGLELPKGQAAHVLRHTFASHFMINGGNILTLQRILGHASLTMTIRYAHLAPDHLQEAKALNPLAIRPKSSVGSPLEATK
ncbi:MAG: tyrosine-type recombinase/integrase [Thiobacillus sp.]|nr:tyrosine-type recombinase/integrase [Thiobacillus sp.]